MPTLQLATRVRDARLEAIETDIGTSPILRIFDGTMPANCAAPDVGTVLSTLNLPSDWMNPASGGVKELAGTWQDAAADASGTAQYFRIYNSGDSFCGMQGDISATGGSGAMTVDNVSFAQNQQFTITTFTLTDGNA